MQAVSALDRRLIARGCARERGGGMGEKGQLGTYDLPRRRKLRLARSFGSRRLTAISRRSGTARNRSTRINRARSSTERLGANRIIVSTPSALPHVVPFSPSSLHSRARLEYEYGDQQAHTLPLFPLPGRIPRSAGLSGTD